MITEMKIPKIKLNIFDLLCLTLNIKIDDKQTMMAR